ncbi:DNA-binding transcriptional response regulator, NtrC family, contains REC, AAA-type ATPase, and a Fis-type DNA-binding domains [Dyella jiangningensis]|uniref:sigma-54-dependent transcriptional regulator n=1 Tax=Dyella sp. AtDHG13 TaxID=1938897 RepID=UPI00088E43B6|nr:sigma-54 dependent transcriptional regulator [Dyella sp. AtDHG13]PXV55820.1 DNA-binding NtrC family response regulator [Dyella sp. AtDHG13]SDK55409.1 DNA-binding transcriptional response regulator, NtrC family, contains REC, AAA-type ATPase, and a Fis-type DNA-binding domains [Dyella jiangningensis]
MRETAPSILLVDDDRIFLNTTRDYARLKGCDVHTASTVEDAVRTIEQRLSPDLMLLDLALPDGSGLEILDRLDNHDCGEVVVLTGAPDLDTAVRAMHLRVDDYVVKPMHGGHLDDLLQRAALRARHRTTRARSHDTPCGELIGDSPVMRRMFRLIERVAPMDNTILIHGESGVGKELVARAIHQYSGRSGAFVAVNGGTLSHELAGSQLFGHERGSFTGATRDHPGYFEQAHGGTLFLDEFTDMPLVTQAYLLRALETRDITRLGARSHRHIDVRVVAACNRNPGIAVRKGDLREDLYYRLADFPIEVPPLRARGDDVLLLAHRFLRTLNHQHGTAYTYSDASTAFMLRHAWPGNVRELLHLVRRAYLLAERGELHLDALGGADLGTSLRASRHAEPAWSGQTLDELERQAIELALLQCHNDRTRAARMLGVSVKTIYNKLMRYRQQPSES